MTSYLEFEKTLAELDSQISQLEELANSGDAAAGVKKDLQNLRTKAREQVRQIYAGLDPWQKVQVARHPDRPHGLDYINGLIEDFTPLAGDRAFAEDHAIVGGLGRFQGTGAAILAQEKGADTQMRMKRNFGMARPEGYRKAVRIMGLAARYALPVITFVDTPGAYPGIGAEERGQAQAIAQAIQFSLDLPVANIALVVGEGGSGGALALATANKILMLEHAVYTVASPEAAASIIWRDAQRAADVARAMKITAQDLFAFGIADGIVAEPLGGAHRDPAKAIAAAGKAIAAQLEGLAGMDGDALRAARREKFLAIGEKTETAGKEKPRPQARA